MNLTLYERLFSDPRLRMLSHRMRCPARALGLLCYIWHGTQNMSGIYLDATQILSSIPLGTRRDPRWINLLLDCGWIASTSERNQLGEPLYRIIGNEKHVQAREKLSENGKAGAEKRWGIKNGPAINVANGPTHGPPYAQPTNQPTNKKEEERLEEVSKEFEKRSDLSPTHPEVRFFEADFQQRFGGGPLTKQERRDAAAIIQQCADARVSWQQLLQAYAGDKFKNREGSFTWLKFNAREVIRAIPKPKPAVKYESADEMTARLLREARDAERRADGEA